MGTSFCSTWTTSTSGAAPGAPDTCFGRIVPMIRPMTNKQNAPPIQNLYFESVFIVPPAVRPSLGIEILYSRRIEYLDAPGVKEGRSILQNDERSGYLDGFRSEALDRENAKGNENQQDRKSTRLNSSHTVISYAVFCLKKKTSSTTPDGL